MIGGAAGGGLDDAIHVLRHLSFGEIALFVAPVEQPGTSQTCEIVVDRTITIPGPVDPAPNTPAAVPDSGPPTAGAHSAPSPTVAPAATSVPDTPAPGGSAKAAKRR